MPLSLNSTRAALVVAHPSHELRLHGWLEKTRPYVCILTDGGGRSGEPRLSRTTEVLARVGATPGAIYGRLGDLEVYSAILKEDCKLFADLVEELAQAFVDEQIEISMLSRARKPFICGNCPGTTNSNAILYSTGQR